MNETVDHDLEKITTEHEFSSPWEDSDLVLVVEEQKFYVHRTILMMASPVFKAMLSSNFKEKDADEIILPGKKDNEFVDLLRQIYPLHYGEITLKNIKYIYSLADEYQMTKVMKDCRIFLSSTRKTKENAMDMLLLAQDLEAEEPRQQCYGILNKMTLTLLESLEGFSELDGSSMQALLLPKVKRLQQCINKIIPEFVGALDGMMYLWSHENNSVKMSGVPSKCPKHIISSTKYCRGRFEVDTIYERIKCDECRAMLKQMAKKASSYSSPSSAYISENIVSVLEEMMDLIKEHKLSNNDCVSNDYRYWLHANLA